MNLVIDIGNTRAKLCAFDGDKASDLRFCDPRQDSVLALALDMCAQHGIGSCIVCSVNGDTCGLARSLVEANVSVLEFSSLTPVPISSVYGTPGTLGADRLAAAVGAHALFPDSDTLIIDAGTAITYDYLRNGREFAGGNIAPGLRMRLRALHDYTRRLPLVEPMGVEREFGLSTREAISNGAVMGVVGEIEAYWERFKQKNVKPVIILTGGDSILLSEKLKITIFAEPNLVLIGLNRILNYNVLKTD